MGPNGGAARRRGRYAAAPGRRLKPDAERNELSQEVRDYRLTTCDARRLSLFLVLFFCGRVEPGRRTQRLAVIEERQIAHVQRERAARRLLVHDHSDRTAFDAL